MIQNSCTDIAIIGGGLVGYTTALAFARAGFSVNVFEAKPLDLDKLIQTEGRAIALAHTSCVLYQSLGLWPALQEQATPIQHIHVSQQHAFGKCNINAQDYDLSALGYVIPATHLVKCLFEAVRTHENIQLIAPIDVTHIDNQPHQAIINHQYSSRLILACDGTQSFTRDYFQLGESEKSYDQQAVVANVSLNIPHENIAYQRFTESGVFALLPLPGKRMTAVLTLDKKDFDQLPTGEVYLAFLQKIFGTRNGLLSELGARFDYPLTWMEANQIVIGRTVLLGNAAHTISPIAAQGLNLALRDIAMLYDILIKTPDAIGSAESLQQYAQHSAQAQKKVLDFTDKLTEWVKPKSFKPFRSAGLFALDHLPGFKHRLAQSMMGFSSHGGSLMREQDHD